MRPVRFTDRPDTIVPYFPSDVELLIRSFWPATRYIGDFGVRYINEKNCFFCKLRMRLDIFSANIPILEKEFDGTKYYTCGKNCHHNAKPVHYYFFAPKSMNIFEKLWYAIDVFYKVIVDEEKKDRDKIVRSPENIYIKYLTQYSVSVLFPNDDRTDTHVDDDIFMDQDEFLHYCDSSIVDNILYGGNYIVCDVPTDNAYTSHFFDYDNMIIK